MDPLKPLLFYLSYLEFSEFLFGALIISQCFSLIWSLQNLYWFICLIWCPKNLYCYISLKTSIAVSLLSGVLRIPIVSSLIGSAKNIYCFLSYLQPQESLGFVFLSYGDPRNFFDFISLILSPRNLHCFIPLIRSPLNFYCFIPLYCLEFNIWSLKTSILLWLKY